MAHLVLNSQLLSELKGKVVVLTGGASGIGRATVELFASHGAKVIFGDIQDQAAREVVSNVAGTVTFVHCDTSSYTDQLNLFEQAAKLHGTVDIVIANAGVVSRENILASSSDWTKEPVLPEIDINLKGVLFTVRIGAAYLRQNGGGDIVMVSSISGFKETPGLPVYTATKHGVIGILRGWSIDAIKENIRINAVCPWMTKTAMAKPLEEGWCANKLPCNEAEDVAISIIICVTNGLTSPFTGKIVWIGGGKSFEIEDRIQSLEPQWLGVDNSKELARGQAYLAQFGFS